MIETTDIKLYKSFENSLYSSNGGPVSTQAIQNNTTANIFKNVSDSERLAGSVTYVKIFWKIDNLDNTALTNAIMYMPKYTIGGDYIVFFKGTNSDTQMSITGSERYYGAAPLTIAASTGMDQIKCSPEHSTINQIIKTGDDILLIENAIWERHNNITATIVDATIQITLNTNDTLQNNFTTNAIVCSVCDLGTITGSTTTPTVNSANGVFNSGTYPVEHRNKGGLDQTWTLTFNNSTQYTCRGNTVGYVGSGSINIDFAPINTALSAPYFMIRCAAFNDAWQEGDTVTFITYAAARGIWLKRIVPAGTVSTSNLFEIAVYGESA